MTVLIEKPKCPKCGVELVLVKEGEMETLPKKCEKCNFRIQGFDQFLDWLETASEKVTEKKKAAKKKATSGEDDSWFGNL